MTGRFVTKIVTMSWKTIYSQRAKDLGGILRDHRLKLGLSLRELEDIIGLSRTIIHKIELGERRLDFVEFLDLCEYLDADPVKIIKILKN